MAADAMGVEESQARLVHEEKAPCPILKAMATRGNQRLSEAIRAQRLSGGIQRELVKLVKLEAIRGT